MYNVLLVDDEPRTIDALERSVDWRSCGIRKVFRSVSMQEAIGVIEKESPQIMICDIEMPSGSGLQLLEWLQEQKKVINCIFVTCHPEFDYMRKAIQLKCYDYILKPINYEEFSRVLTELVHKMEALENGQDTAQAVNWGGITDFTIQQSGRVEKERNVESEVKKYIREHMMDNITVTSIAEELHFNPQYLMRAFKSKTEMSIVEYITKARMDTARKILAETELPIKEVANMVGYGDYAYFTRVFRKETGESPSRYRNDHRK
ncbi:MAG: AraC family transcriptional regulator [Lachnospiraceae bacterium]|nr:AraC family transcriptional regulator [Lachnospiraceae bacterium]